MVNWKRGWYIKLDQLTAIVWENLSKQDYSKYSNKEILKIGLESLENIFNKEIEKIFQSADPNFVEHCLGKFLWVLLSMFKALGIEPEQALRFANDEIQTPQKSVVELVKSFKDTPISTVPAINDLVDSYIKNSYNFSVVFGGEDGCQILYKENTNIGYVNFITSEEKEEILINEFYLEPAWDNDLNRLSIMHLFMNGIKEKNIKENKVYKKLFSIKAYEAFGGPTNWMELMGFKTTSDKPTWSASYGDTFAVITI